MAKRIVRLVTRDTNGILQTKDLEDLEPIHQRYEQLGIDDCSTDLGLRGWPIFRGLVGPMPDGRGVARYEAPDVFEAMTKDWANAKTKRRRRRTREQILADQEREAMMQAAGE